MARKFTDLLNQLFEHFEGVFEVSSLPDDFKSKMEEVLREKLPSIKSISSDIDFTQ